MQKEDTTEEIIEGLQKQHSNKFKFLVITLSIIGIIIFFILLISAYFYFQAPEKTLGIGANIESALLSADGKISYIKLVGGSLDKNITKIKFIFTDENGNENYYETSEGVQSIEVPFKRSFWDWLFGKPAFSGKYDYEINSDKIGLNDFNNINEVSVVFEYETKEGETAESPVLDTTKTTTKTTTTGGGGDGGGGGGGGTTPPSQCTPTKTCDYYYNLNQCGSGLNDGCSDSLDCLSCNTGTYCYQGQGESNLCINNSVNCFDSDSGIDYYVKGNVTINSLLSEDFCFGNITIDFYCYYNGSDFEIRNETKYCDFGCDNGKCKLPEYGSDSVLELSRTGGYASLSNSNFTDLDYSKDFSVESLARIEAFQRGGRWGALIQKGLGNVIWSSSSPGFAIGTYTGNEEAFSKQIMAKIGDGTNAVSITSPGSYQGDIYVLMTWEVSNKNMTLYINGKCVGSSINPAILPNGIENNERMRIGKSEYNLMRDIFMARLWNRKLSSSEVINLWDNYNTTGQHTPSSTFDSSELHSEWLMQETSDAYGNVGTTHIKDTAGNDHLELIGGAEISAVNGPLTLIYPLDSELNVDKAIILRAAGGVSDLGSPVRPLHYYFQIDESPDFNSPNLKESGWIKHYGKYKPVLKPNTQYYWRAKVKDSNSTPIESPYTQTASFTTEGPTDWYVRPLVDIDGSRDSLNNPIVDEGIYGNQDGNSYDNAWNGIFSIKWGEEGVEAGDILYICGTHVYHYYYSGYWDPPTIGNIKESGFSDEYPITITTDCPDEKGVLWKIAKDMTKNSTWNGPDANGVYWTSDLRYGASVEYNGTDYIWLDRESNITWQGHPGAVYTTQRENEPWLTNRTYVKTTDGSNPIGKIYYNSPWGFSLNLGRSSFIKFHNCTFFNGGVGKNGKSGTVSELEVSKNITFENSELAYGGTLISLTQGMDNWVVRNCDLHDAGEGIYASTPGHVYNLLVENNKIHDIGPPNFPSSDCHAIGIQNGANHIFQNNTIWNTGGTAIEFWACSYTMKNMTVRNNFIKDTYVGCNTGANGISISGCNSESWGQRTGFKVYNNIIMNTALEAPDGWWGGTGIGSNNKDFVEIYNNIIVNPYKHGISFTTLNPDSPPQGAIYNNIIVNPGSKYLSIYGVGNWSNFSCDHNLYYDTPDFTSDFSFSQTIDRDNNSILADPMFVSPISNLSKREDFMLQPESPAIDAGIDVGLPYLGSAPDIGAYEYQGGIGGTSAQPESLQSEVSSLSLASQIYNWLKGLLTKETGKAILTGKTITGNDVNESDENSEIKVPYIILSLLAVIILIIVVVIVKTRKNKKKSGKKIRRR